MVRRAGGTRGNQMPPIAGTHGQRADSPPLTRGRLVRVFLSGGPIQRAPTVRGEIVLIGRPRAGKTTVGRLLSERFKVR